MSPPDGLEALERWLGGAVGEALEVALAVETPGGSSAAWAALLARFDTASTPEEDRRRAAAATQQRFGAAPDELYGVLSRIVERGGRSLDALSAEGPGAERRWERLRGRLGELREETVAAYRKRVMPKRSMFAQAFESARPANGVAVNREAFVMRCRACGAPRLKDGVFECAYCATPFAGDG